VKNFEAIVKTSIISALDGARQDLNFASAAARKHLAKDIFDRIISEYRSVLAESESVQFGDELLFEEE
jgi:hypothetical protein